MYCKLFAGSRTSPSLIAKPPTPRPHWNLPRLLGPRACRLGTVGSVGTPTGGHPNVQLGLVADPHPSLARERNDQYQSARSGWFRVSLRAFPAARPLPCRRVSTPAHPSTGSGLSSPSFPDTVFSHACRQKSWTLGSEKLSSNSDLASQ